MTAQALYDAARVKPRPTTLVFDIETVSHWDALPLRARTTMVRKAREADGKRPVEARGDPRNDPQAMASLSPWTGQVVCLAMYDPASAKGRCLFVGSRDVVPARAGFRFEPFGTERDLLVEFWATLQRCPDARLVGFNSRDFDGQYLHVRSYIHDVPCTANLTPYRYSTKEHLDLYDVLGGWGAGRAPGLDVCSEIAGIPSPKAGGMEGSMVQVAWDEGRIAEIARYCAEDVVATAGHLERWERTVGMVFGERRKW